MRPLPPSGDAAAPSRVEITREAGLLRITLRPRRHLLVTLFLAVWVCGWALGEWTAIRNLLDPRSDGGAIAFLAFWLTGWTVGGLLAIAVLLYALAGREEITVDGRDLRIRYAALGLGWTRTRDLAGIERLEPTSPPGAPTAPPGRPSGRPLAYAGPGAAIQLVHRGRQLLFAGGLEPHDLEAIVAELRARLPRARHPDF